MLITMLFVEYILIGVAFAAIAKNFEQPDSDSGDWAVALTWPLLATVGVVVGFFYIIDRLAKRLHAR